MEPRTGGKTPREHDISMSDVSGIYNIYNWISSKDYIGSSYRVFFRLSQHRKALESGNHINPHLQAAWNLYGPDAFLFSLLEKWDVNNLESREQYWMDRINVNGGYNLVNAKRGKYPNPEASLERKKRWEGLTDEERKIHSAQLITPENLLGNSIRLKEKWQDPIFRSERLEGLDRGRVKTNSSNNPKILDNLTKGREKAILRSRTDPIRKKQQSDLAKSQFANERERILANLTKGRAKTNAKKKADAALRRANNDIVLTEEKSPDITNKHSDE